jgi:hypothetical protein
MRLSLVIILLGTSCSEYAFKNQDDGVSGSEREGFDSGEPGITLDVDVDEVFEISLDLEVNKLDVAFLLDTTGSMGATANAVADEYTGIVAELDETVGDAAYGFATFDDYNFALMGSSVDRPFILHQQITTDRMLVQDALNAVVIHSGGDIEESSMEGLYQGLTGAGYDQENDGYYNADTDVRPFISDPSDIFGGSAASTNIPSTPGAGTIGGYGFREGSLPVIVYATDAYMRDPHDGYAYPPTANRAAGRMDVIDAVESCAARLIGISTQSSLPLPQMEQLAYATGSLYAADSDGIIDDPLALTWTGSSSAFRTTVVDAIQGMLVSVSFATVTAEVTDNPWGFDTEVTPDSYSDITMGTTAMSLSFTVTVSGEVAASTEDQSFPLTLSIYGDGTTLLGTHEITVLVPASL